MPQTRAPLATRRHETLLELLTAGDAAAPAIGAPGRPALAHGELHALLAAVRAQLRAHGLGRDARIALVLPNGPEMATCFLAIACAATAAPLNPAYRTDEFEFTLADLGAQALVVERGSTSPALAAAARLGLRVIELVPADDAAAAAGRFTLGPPPPGGVAAADSLPGPDEVALVLHTSGTTSRPKIVPLLQRNLVASARNIAQTLALGPGDRGLNIMPLFHIHGLMAGLLAPLAAGSAVWCTPGFNALRFFAWLDESAATWYSAVPTMHQAILARAAAHRELIARRPLRFIRSSSSSIPPQVIGDLEAAFGAPLIEAYGMTEAAHQMASNPLPPAPRKPGSVGPAAGPEIAVMDASGRLLEAGATGEIVIRGANVMSGYERNPQANAEAYRDGWFRTGDEGVLDEEGYLRITGRLKELINRGGEKISPREIDEILMDHPDVAQVVCFAMPHPKLGEEVGAAVVLREGRQVGERELQAFVAARVADFKVPRKIVLLAELPKGATGKLQRIGLAQRLGLA